ncbi:MAG: glutamyl-tRNA reductase [Deltaproteobacteria bacterium]|jgi:glutamyl-tRNA reductase|nr:glutamyl-tRNA reductase [Deltaproteobacteria bacterium]
MDILVLGVAHWNAPVAIREKLAKGKLEDRALFEMCAGGLISEGLVLSTCNRLEIIVAAKDVGAARSELLALMAQSASLTVEQLEKYSHSHLNLAAVDYIFRVASGLDSQVLGEPQILGQVKDAYRSAIQFRTVGPMISKIFHKSFQTAKRIRTETEMASGAVSIAYAAVQTLQALLGSLRGQKALIIGAGEMATLLADHLKAKGASLTVISRSLQSAEELAAKSGAQVALLSELSEQLALSDIAATAFGATEPVLTEKIVAEAIDRKLCIVDLGLPRNVEEAVGNLPGVTLKNIDDFKAVVRQNQSLRLEQADRAKTIIEEEVFKFSQWLSSLSASPTIKDLIKLAEEARLLELERTKSRNDFSPGQVEALEAMGRALVRRILHSPLTFAKGCHRHGRGDHSLDVFRRIFGLDG